MSTKWIKISMWICIVILSLQLIAAGSGKFTGSWAGKFSQWGYPAWLMYVIGLLELAGVAGLYHYKTRSWAAAVLMLVMAGAAFTHITNEEFPRVIHNLIVAGVAFLVLMLNKIRSSA